MNKRYFLSPTDIKSRTRSPYKKQNTNGFVKMYLKNPNIVGDLLYVLIWFEYENTYQLDLNRECISIAYIIYIYLFQSSAISNKFTLSGTLIQPEGTFSSRLRQTDIVSGEFYDALLYYIILLYIHSLGFE